jgi:hypothetical protein
MFEEPRCGECKPGVAKEQRSDYKDQVKVWMMMRMMVWEGQTTELMDGGWLETDVLEWVDHGGHVNNGSAAKRQIVQIGSGGGGKCDLQPSVGSDCDVQEMDNNNDNDKRGPFKEGGLGSSMDDQTTTTTMMMIKDE